MISVQKTLGAVLSGGIIFIIGIIILSVSNGSPFVIVGAGERGVKLRFGAVSETVLGEGLHFKIPIIESVRIMDVKIQKREVEAASASRDLQTLRSLIALNYHVDPAQVARLYQEVGVLYEFQVIDPALQESIKASTAKFTAEELITRREDVREEMKRLMKEKLIDRGIIVVDLNVINFEFSAAFDVAIEGKVTAEQEALAAKNKLERIKFEAQQKIEESKGNAEAITIESNALRNNPQILELRALEKWDGVLPQVVTGENGAIPFINIK